MQDLFGPFEAKIGPAQDQQRDEHPGRECIQEHGDGQEDAQFVEERGPRNLCHDGYLARRGKPVHVFRRDRRVVNDDAGRFSRRPLPHHR